MWDKGNAKVYIAWSRYPLVSDKSLIYNLQTQDFLMGLIVFFSATDYYLIPGLSQKFYSHALM